MIIRKANQEDARVLQVLLYDSVAAMRANGVEQWDEVYPSIESLNYDIAAGTLDVLCDDELVIACVTIDQRLDPLWAGMNWSPLSEPAAAVHRLIVHPSRQGKGLAKQLMRHAEGVAARMNCRSIRLDCFLLNPAAMKLYQSLGYRQTGKAMMRKGVFAGFEKLIGD